MIKLILALPVFAAVLGLVLTTTPLSSAYAKGSDVTPTVASNSWVSKPQPSRIANMSVTPNQIAAGGPWYPTINAYERSNFNTVAIITDIALR